MGKLLLAELPIIFEFKLFHFTRCEKDLRNTVKKLKFGVDHFSPLDGAEQVQSRKERILKRLNFRLFFCVCGKM